MDQIGEEISHPAPTAAKKSSTAKITSPTLGTGVDAQHAEEILRQEARRVLESIAWKMIPDIVERVVREELQKLLKDAERL